MRFPAIELSQAHDRRKRVALSIQSGSPTRQARGGPGVAESVRCSRQSGSPTRQARGGPGVAESVRCSRQSGSPTRQARGGPGVAESVRCSRQSGSPTRQARGGPIATVLAQYQEAQAREIRCNSLAWDSGFHWVGNNPDRSTLRCDVRARRSRLRSALLETERVEIRIPHFETQSHWLASESTEIAISLPGHRTFQIVTVDFVAIGQREAGHRLAVDVLNFDSHRAGSGRRDIQGQLVPGKSDRFSEQFASRQRGVQRDESIDAQRVAADDGAPFPEASAR